MKHIIEGLLFLSGDEGISKEQLLETLEIDEKELEEEINKLMDEYIDDKHGIELVHFGGKYKFVTKEVVYEYAERLFSSNRMATLSSAALETLAIVAYKQPVTRAEIEEIRGVGCDSMIRKLVAKALIKDVGREDTPGMPILYGVTDEFMDAFALTSLDELPDLADVAEVQEQEDLFSTRYREEPDAEDTDAEESTIEE